MNEQYEVLHRTVNAGHARSMRRLFLALWPDEKTRHALYRALPRELRGIGRRVPADSLHVTLAFLGHVGDDRLDGIEQAVAGCTEDRTAFVLKFDRLGCFPRRQVLWLGSREMPAALAALVECLRRRLESHGFGSDRRVFRPHVTLMRKVRIPGRMPAVEPLFWRVGDIRLIESETRSGGAVYTELQRWPLSVQVCDNSS